MSAIELRRATPSDAAAIRDLTREAYAKWVPLIGREPKPMTADYDAAPRRLAMETVPSQCDLSQGSDIGSENRMGI